MAHAPDGLIEAFYDPAVCDPEEGKFIVGLQFHPERMRHEHDIPIESQTSEELMQESIFDYPECPRIYQVPNCNSIESSSSVNLSIIYYILSTSECFVVHTCE